MNISDVKKITNIRSLLFVHRNHGQEREDSMVVISIEANKNDYLQERDTEKVVDGSKRYKEIETVWSFTPENGQWKVSDIEEGSMSLAYAKLMVELPDRESVRFESLMSGIRTATRRNRWMSGRSNVDFHLRSTLLHGRDLPFVHPELQNCLNAYLRPKRDGDEICLASISSDTCVAGLA